MSIPVTSHASLALSLTLYALYKQNQPEKQNGILAGPFISVNPWFKLAYI